MDFALDRFRKLVLESSKWRVNDRNELSYYDEFIWVQFAWMEKIKLWKVVRWGHNPNCFMPKETPVEFHTHLTACVELNRIWKAILNPLEDLAKVLRGKKEVTT